MRRYRTPGYRLGKALLFLSIALCIGACNKSSDLETTDDRTSLAVTSFTLKADLDNTGLDSAYFAIDLNHGVIYNPDSLRKGTAIDKVVPVISYSTDVEKAVINMTGGKTRTGEVDYKDNPTDSIDFTGAVTLTLSKGELSKTYRLKVNVHTEVSDSLRWDEAARTSLPAIPGKSPSRQKTVMLADSTVICLAEYDSDHSFSMAYSTDPNADRWTVIPLSLPFTPRTRSFSVAENDIYILADNGDLYRNSFSNSDDFSSNWQKVDSGWHAVIGSYLGSIVGLRLSGDHKEFTQYPAIGLNTAASVPDDFPVSGFSDFVTLQNKWTSSPVAFFVGGRTSSGSLSDDTWAFDGAEWIRLSTGGIPPLEGAALVPYYYYRPAYAGNTMLEYNVWMIIGGNTIADGVKCNRTVYISFDNGVNWQQGSPQLQLPASVPALYQADNLVINKKMSASISDNWKKAFRRNAPLRLSHTVDGEIISWECPYIFLFGGISDTGFSDTVWRGVLTRLTFTPII